MPRSRPKGVVEDVKKRDTGVGKKEAKEDRKAVLKDIFLKEIQSEDKRGKFDVYRYLNFSGTRGILRDKIGSHDDRDRGWFAEILKECEEDGTLKIISGNWYQRVK